MFKIHSSLSQNIVRISSNSTLAGCRTLMLPQTKREHLKLKHTQCNLVLQHTAVHRVGRKGQKFLLCHTKVKAYFRGTDKVVHERSQYPLNGLNIDTDNSVQTINSKEHVSAENTVLYMIRNWHRRFAFHKEFWDSRRLVTITYCIIALKLAM